MKVLPTPDALSEKVEKERERRPRVVMQADAGVPRECAMLSEITHLPLRAEEGRAA